MGNGRRCAHSPSAQGEGQGRCASSAAHLDRRRKRTEAAHHAERGGGLLPMRLRWVHRELRHNDGSVVRNLARGDGVHVRLHGIKEAEREAP
eukprot:scaffold119678_cov33-Tisochrysis_lutea.AAC.2